MGTSSDARRAREKFVFLASHLLVYILGEIAYLVGNVLSTILFSDALGLIFWRLAVRLNRHHLLAAINVALVLGHRGDSEAWSAFLYVVEVVRNPWNTSGSDLYLTWIPGRSIRRFVVRLIWGRAAFGSITLSTHDELQRSALAQLAAYHTKQAIDSQQTEHATEALGLWQSLGANSLEMAWAAAAIAVQQNDWEKAASLSHPLIKSGQFVSPFDTLWWADVFLHGHKLELASICVEWAVQWIPECAQTWYLRGQLAHARNDPDAAYHDWTRALALDPQNLGVYLDRLTLKEGWPQTPPMAIEGKLSIDVPLQLALGTSVTVCCQIRDVSGDWVLHVLPPAGWGIISEPRTIVFDLDGTANVTIHAQRPDRIRGDAWPIRFLAISSLGYLLVQANVTVPDPRPGQVLVTITEDHEIHEERGNFTAAILQRLLVAKSDFAASMLAVPWTHMVEVGSVLGMTAYGDVQDGKEWYELHLAVREHLVNEIQKGNDIQPHLHAFNDPVHSRFPYQFVGSGWRPSLAFLLTEPSLRGDWASACPPQTHGYSRASSVAKAVAQLEQIGHLADPDYRPVLWRSGLLDYGDSQADRVWSGVALRRAGLLADSDVAKPGSPLADVVPSAYMMGWSSLSSPEPGGQCLQLPVVANLEGDYLMDSALLRRRTKNSIQALRRTDGRVQPGIYLFTLLTHDKFVNARAEGDEWRLEQAYGDWVTIRQNVADWQNEGAVFVSAREGIESVLNDRSWSPLTRLSEETFVYGAASQQYVRYRVRVLGEQIPFSNDYPQQALVTIPPYIRDYVVSIEARQGSRSIAVDWHKEGCYLWLELRQVMEPVHCTFSLSDPVGPVADVICQEQNCSLEVQFRSRFPFRSARFLLRWEYLTCIQGGLSYNWRVTDVNNQVIDCNTSAEGLLLTAICFSEPPIQHDGYYVTRLVLNATPQ